MTARAMWDVLRQSDRIVAVAYTAVMSLTEILLVLLLGVGDGEWGRVAVGLISLHVMWTITAIVWCQYAVRRLAQARNPVMVMPAVRPVTQQMLEDAAVDGLNRAGQKTRRH